MISRFDSKTCTLLLCELFSFESNSERWEMNAIWVCLPLIVEAAKKFSRMKWHRAVYIRQMIHILSDIWITLQFFFDYFNYERVLYDVCQRRAHKYCAVMMNNRLFRFLWEQRNKKKLNHSIVNLVSSFSRFARTFMLYKCWWSVEERIK